MVKIRDTPCDLSERLRLRGWQVPAFTLGGEATDIVVMRIMCRRGFEMDFAELLLEDYKASLKYLSDHPKLQGIAQQNSFKHLITSRCKKPNAQPLKTGGVFGYLIIAIIYYLSIHRVDKIYVI